MERADLVLIGNTSAPPSCVFTLVSSAQVSTESTFFLRTGSLTLDFESSASWIDGRDDFAEG